MQIFKLFTILVFLLILEGCNQKAPKNIELAKFLPEVNTTKFHYITTMINEPSHPEFDQKDILTEKVIVSRKDNCVEMELYTHFSKEEIEQMPKEMKKHIKDNRLQSDNEILCADNNQLTSSGYTLYDKDGDWDIRVESTDVNGTVMDVMSGACHFVVLTKEIIFGKQREVIHTRCMYAGENVKTKMDDFIVEGLGVYKSIMKSDIKFDDIENHSVMTTLLVKYE